MLVSSNPRSRKRFRAADRMRFRVSPALGVPRAGLVGVLRVGSIASRRVNVAEFEQSRPRKTMRPMPIALERVQAHEPGMLAQIHRSVVAHHYQLTRRPRAASSG